MNILEVEGLCKTYPAFALRDVSFAVEPGTIMGFIGRNGAGKSTTIKSMLNLVHPDSGRVTMFGQNFYANEPACKQQLGVVLGGVDFYPNKKLRSITNVTRTFYDRWDEDKSPALSAAVRARRDEEGLAALVRHAREVYARACALARCAPAHP